MIKANARPEYFPVYYLEPLTGNEASLGFDLWSIKFLEQIFQISRDRGSPQALSGIRPTQKPSNQKEFIAFLPIYSGSPRTVEKRRKNLSGFVLGTYDIGTIFNNSALGDKPSGIDITLVDHKTPDNTQELYKHKSRTGSGTFPGITYQKSLPEIWGQKWTLLTSPTYSYVKSRRNLFPYIIFCFGVIFTTFILFYISITSRRTAIIQQQVIEKTEELSKLNEQLKLLSRSDPLTGIANRRYMDETLDREWSRAIRNKTHISFILADIDCFKDYNDNYGHVIGDTCLKKVATTLEALINRPTDLVARYGGEEFALILSETENAASIAESCRKAIEDLQIPHGHSSVSNVITISVGLCTYEPRIGIQASTLIKSADKALYKAKESGRNAVRIFQVDSQDIQAPNDQNQDSSSS